MKNENNFYKFSPVRCVSAHLFLKICELCDQQVIEKSCYLTLSLTDVLNHVIVELNFFPNSHSQGKDSQFFPQILDCYLEEDYSQVSLVH